MAPPEDPETEFGASAHSPLQHHRLPLPKGRGCKSGRGLPLQQRKLYRNLARQTPRVQGLTFDHNQIRWISYWKNDQNKQVQKHFPVSRHGFLGARKLALEERNRVMGWPLDKDEAAEAIASLKIDPSVPCFLDGESPMHSEGVAEDGSAAEDFSCGGPPRLDSRLALPSEVDEEGEVEQSDAQTETPESGCCFSDFGFVPSLKRQPPLSLSCGASTHAAFGAKRHAGVSAAAGFSLDRTSLEEGCCASLSHTGGTTAEAILGSPYAPPPRDLANAALPRGAKAANSSSQSCAAAAASSSATGSCFPKTASSSAPCGSSSLCEETALRGGPSSEEAAAAVEDFLARTWTRSTTAADCGGGDRRGSLAGRLTSLASCAFEENEIGGTATAGESSPQPHHAHGLGGVSSGSAQASLSQSCGASSLSLLGSVAAVLEEGGVATSPLLCGLSDAPGLKDTSGEIDAGKALGIGAEDSAAANASAAPGVVETEMIDADALGGEFSVERCAMGAFCLTEGNAFCASRERPSPLSPTSASLEGGVALSEEALASQCTRLPVASFASRRMAASGEGGLTALGGEPAPESPTFLRRVYECCDSHKAQCMQLVRDLYKSLRAKGEPPCASGAAGSPAAGFGDGALSEWTCIASSVQVTVEAADALEEAKTERQEEALGGGCEAWEEVLRNEEAVLLSALDCSSDLCDLSRFAGVFRRCFVDNVKPSELPVEEMRLMASTLRCLLGPDGLYSLNNSASSAALLDAAEATSSVPYPFRDRRGVVHRLLLSPDAQQQQRLSPASGATASSPLGTRGNNAALSGILAGAATQPTSAGATGGRGSGLTAAGGGSLFKGPRHAPSSPTAALYAGCFSKATEIAARGNPAGVV